MDVVDKISALAADSNQLALERVEIKKVSLRPILPPVPIPFSETSNEELNSFRVRLESSLGNILIELSPDVAPETCRNFLKLSKVGLFDGTDWHRIVPGVVIQGGDMSTRATAISAEQMAQYVKNLQPEFSDTKHVKGTVSMARGDSPDSASTSFFICLADAPSLMGNTRPLKSD
jgi:peptidyl-prolyl cis-trans isomerase B (cyclophilin B)